MGLDISKIGDYELDGKTPLGEGAFGAVYKAKHVKKGHSAAVKRCLIKSDMHGSLAMKEIKIFQKIPPHKHIVKMLDFEYLVKSFWIIMEFCDRGDLEKYMKKYSPNLDRQLKIMYQCACAVSHMHSQEDPIVHRDIKPQNILFKNENGREVVKMADFGLTKVSEAAGNDAKTGKAGKGMSSQVGTPPFMAPELFAGTAYGESVDTFALGLVFLSMINFKPSDEHLIPLTPLGESKLAEGEFMSIGQEMLQAKLNGSDQPTVARVSPLDGGKMKGIKSLINDMTVYDKDERKPMTEVVTALQKIAAGSNPSSMVSESVIKGLTLSNLSVAKTKIAPSIDDSTVYERERPSEKVLDMPSTVREEGSDSSSDSNSDDGEDSTPDLGYLLLHQMIQDGLRKKREEEAEKQERAKKSAVEAMERLLPLMALMKLLDSDQESGSKFTVGDKVVVDKDMQKVKAMQVDHGGWAKGMDKYLNEQGRVKSINDDIVAVTFPNGQSLRFNALLLTKVGIAKDDDNDGHGKKSRLVKGKFKMLDVVEFNVKHSELSKLQTGHGGFNRRMENCWDLRGVVHRVFDDGDVYVEFMNGDKWCVNPDALKLVDTSGEEIEAGDVVIISDDKEKVKKKQKGHGEWNEKMTESLGCSGIVRKVGKIADSGNMVAVVEVDSSRWTFNLESLKLVAKGEQMVLMMLKKQLASD